MSWLSTLVPKPYLLIAGLATIVALLTFTYFKGYRAAERQYTQQLVEQLVKEREYLDAVDLMGREIVKAYNTKQVETKVVYRTIKEKVYENTSGTVCLNADAARLWDDALLSIMPNPTTRAAETPARAYTDTEVVTNAIDNFELYKQCRDQLNSLIDWHEKVEAMDGPK